MDEKKKEAEMKMARGIIVRLGDKISYVENGVSRCRVMKCLAGYVESPGHFYVNLAMFYNNLEELMDNMQTTYTGQADQKYVAVPCKDHLKPGFYVAVLRKFDKEWHRGKILSQLTEDVYSVFLIDYGDFVTAEIKDMRYLLKEYFDWLPAQAIRCVAQLGTNYNRTLPDGQVLEYNRGIGYTKEEKELFRKGIFNKNLAIRFKKITKIDGNTSWEVWVHTLIGKSCTIESDHVERQVLVRSQNYYNFSEDEQSEEKLNIRGELKGLPECLVN